MENTRLVGAAILAAALALAGWRWRALTALPEPGDPGLAARLDSAWPGSTAEAERSYALAAWRLSTGGGGGALDAAAGSAAQGALLHDLGAALSLDPPALAALLAGCPRDRPACRAAEEARRPALIEALAGALAGAPELALAATEAAWRFGLAEPVAAAAGRDPMSRAMALVLEGCRRGPAPARAALEVWEPPLRWVALLELGRLGDASDRQRLEAARAAGGVDAVLADYGAWLLSEKITTASEPSP